jgi:phage terminase large subunit GpA-like protein
MVRRVTAAELYRRLQPAAAEAAAHDLLTWTERHRRFGESPMRVPAPLRALYRETAPYVVVMKGAQMGLSEWAINVALHTGDTGRAGRGTALYVQPGGENVGDFVQARVNPAIEQSPYLLSRVRASGSTRDPDKVGLRRIGSGYTYWRTSGSRSGLKSVPVDTLILDEYDEMPAGTLALAQHRLDSSTAPLVRVLSTPTYPGAGIDPEYRGGDQRQYCLLCPECDTWQPLEWDKNVERERATGRPHRVCVRCRESLEATVALAWEQEGVGEWRATAPEGRYPSYHLSQLYRPGLDLEAVAASLSSSNETELREAWNQHLGLPFRRPADSCRSRSWTGSAWRRSAWRRSRGCRTVGWAWTSGRASTSGSSTGPTAGRGCPPATSSPPARWTRSRRWTS